MAPFQHRPAEVVGQGCSGHDGVWITRGLVLLLPWRLASLRRTIPGVIGVEREIVPRLVGLRLQDVQIWGTMQSQMPHDVTD